MKGKTKAKLKVGCGLLAVFSTGFLAGMVVFVLFLARVIPLSEGWKGEDSRSFIMQRLEKRLKLDDEQIALVRPLVESTLDERHRRRADYTREDIDVVRRGLESVREHLDAGQAQRAERLFAEWLRGRQRYLEGEGTDTSEEDRSASSR